MDMKLNKAERHGFHILFRQRHGIERQIAELQTRLIQTITEFKESVAESIESRDLSTEKYTVFLDIKDITKGEIRLKTDPEPETLNPKPEPLVPPEGN